MFSIESAADLAGIPLAKALSWRRAGLVPDLRSPTGRPAAYDQADVFALVVLRELRRHASMQAIRPAWASVMRELRRLRLDEITGKILVVGPNVAAIVATGDRALRSSGPIIATLDLEALVRPVVDRLAPGVGR